MVARHFDHVQAWVFDLDNTLYPPAARLFDQIEIRMTNWVMRALDVPRDEADRLRTEYWERYGTTLAGLMREHGVDPAPYLTEVHDIDLGHLERDPDLRQRISDLPGKKIIHTNGCGPYAERVLAARGLSGIFDEIYGVEHADFLPKPEAQAFAIILEKADISADCSAIFEDDARNLKAPFDMGMRTVHVAETANGDAHVHHHTDDLTGFLDVLTGARPDGAAP